MSKKNLQLTDFFGGGLYRISQRIQTKKSHLLHTNNTYGYQYLQHLIESYPIDFLPLLELFLLYNNHDTSEDVLFFTVCHYAVISNTIKSRRYNIEHEIIYKFHNSNRKYSLCNPYTKKTPYYFLL